MVAFSACDFEHKRSGRNCETFIVKIVKQDDTQHIQQGKACLPLYGENGSPYFENQGFAALNDMKCLPPSAEMKVIPSQRADSRNEMEQRRLSILPLVSISTGRQTSINVQKYYGVDYTAHHPGEFSRMCYILTELCEGTPLDEWMSMRKNIPNEYTIVRCTKQVLQGLEFLHMNHIVHRDIKGANITVMGNSEILKITGLDMARCFSGSGPNIGLESVAGTVPFVSPEMAEMSVIPAGKGMSVGARTDIWSLGCVVIQLMQKGRPPRLTKSHDGTELLQVYPTCTFQDMHHYYKMGYLPKYPCPTTCGHGCKGTTCLLVTEEVKAFLDTCLVADPRKRPVASALLQAPYFHPSFRIVPKWKDTEQQRFLVRRYALTTAAQLEQEYERQPFTGGQRPVLCINPDEHDETLTRLQKKVTLPETAAGTIAPGWVSIISPNDAKVSQPGLHMAMKHKLYKALVKDIPSTTEHIIRHLAVTQSDDILELRVFTESEGNYERLSSVIKKPAFSERLIPDFTKQILEGILLLHKYGIVHQDIRCSNILVQKLKIEDGTQGYRLKIAHFEKALYLSGDSTPRSFISSPEGSSGFASKEMQELLSFDIQEPENVGRATDVFSLGCTVIEMYERSQPRWVYIKNGKLMEYNFNNKPDKDLASFLANMYNLVTFGAEPVTSGISDAEALNFVQSCLKRPSTSRPTCERLQLHRFISGLQASLLA